MDNLPSTREVLSGKIDFKGLSDYFTSNKPAEYLERRERDFWAALGCNPSEVKDNMERLEAAVAKARTKWACISAKTQREKNFKYKNGRFFTVKTYSQLTEISHNWERPSDTAPPPDRNGKVIQRFTSRSRQRMMSKARKLNHNSMRPPDGNGKRKKIDKKLPVPWFVTLTYRKNYQDAETSKDHLNAFLQRWRRRFPDFAYFWKMEPQERGAIHYHLAMFLPDGWEKYDYDYIDFPLHIDKKNGKKITADHKKLMKVISTDWAEVTKKVDGYYSEFERITYRSKRTGKVTPGGHKPAAGWQIDWTHLKYGTNVRRCDNWKMFLGYVYKYMKKEVGKHPFTPPVLLDPEITRLDNDNRIPAVPYYYTLDIVPAKTGRFWGFSYNLDFTALQTGLVDFEDLAEMNHFCNALNTLTFQSLTYHLTENAKRARKQLSGKDLQKKLDHYRNTYESQKRRYKINRDKIKEGLFLQFEINSRAALAVRKFLKEDNINAIFERIRDKTEKELFK